MVIRSNKKDRNETYIINESIRAREVRVLGSDGENFGVIPLKKAIAHAREKRQDIVMISPEANPPVVKMVEYGKFVYEQKKLKKTRKESTKKEEIKKLQIKIGTGKDILDIRAKKIREWLDSGYTVRIDLFLSGRHRFMEEAFLTSYLKNFLTHIPDPYSILEDIRKGGKGYVVVIQP